MTGIKKTVHYGTAGSIGLLSVHSALMMLHISTVLICSHLGMTLLGLVNQSAATTATMYKYLVIMVTSYHVDYVSRFGQ